MRLICPDCGAQYEVPTRVIPVQGRDVQCSACGNTWFQTRNEDETPQVTETIAAPTPQAAEKSDHAAEDQSPLPPNAPAQAASPAPQEDKDAPSPDSVIDRAPPRRSLDPSIAELLREEAHREQAARLSGKSSPQPTVSQDPTISAPSENEAPSETQDDSIVPPLAAALDAHQAPEEDTTSAVSLDDADAQPVDRPIDEAAEDERSALSDAEDDLPMTPAHEGEIGEGSDDVVPVLDMPTEETTDTPWDEADFVETLSSEATADILSDPEEWHDVDTLSAPSDLDLIEPEESDFHDSAIADIHEDESVTADASLDKNVDAAAQTQDDTDLKYPTEQSVEEVAPSPLSTDGEDHIDPEYENVQISRQDIEDSTIPDGQLAAMAVAQNSTERRHRLPDIEEMSQSWSVVDETDARADIEEQRRAQSQRSRAGFNFGFFTIVFLAIASAMIYWRADDIIDQLPQAEAPLDLYVEKVDELRALIKDQANGVGLWVIDLAEKIKAESAVSE